MSTEKNKSYKIRKSHRIRTDIGNDTFLSVQLDQNYDTFDILSLSINQEDAYRLHNSNYGVIVGRVLANNGFGIPNAKVSVFIEADNMDSDIMRQIYGYNTTASKNHTGVRYNLLPDEKVSDCHQPVGTFPSKEFLLSNDVLMEVFDKYYKLTAKTNEAGDYLIAGVPTGNVVVHMDLDISDCGILSQKPRDLAYKGYNIEEFENASMFNKSTAIDSLKQIISQDKNVHVNPFWGTSDLIETIGITRCDIDVNFKFEPTAIFIGSIVSDPQSQGISPKCVPTDQMGKMDELTTGRGRIEMIRKTLGGDTEVFNIKGTELINGDGVWCYQIPMNLDYVVTDEFGNIVPTDDVNKGIPTRTRCRFRVSMGDEGSNETYFRGKILVPHNPEHDSEEYDYVFGTKTKDGSFRDLLWNNVYTVKQFIPRIQRGPTYHSNERFTGIKSCNHNGNNNPMPYNNIRVQMPFNFKILCALIKAYIVIVRIMNRIVSVLCGFLRRFSLLGGAAGKKAGAAALSMRLISIADGLCPDLENWYFTPYRGDNVTGRVFLNNSAAKNTNIDTNSEDDDVDSDEIDAAIDEIKNDETYKSYKRSYAGAITASVLLPSYETISAAVSIKREMDRYIAEQLEARGITSNSAYLYALQLGQYDNDGRVTVDLFNQTLNSILGKSDDINDKQSTDYTNKESMYTDDEGESHDGSCIVLNTDYLMQCIEMNLAQEYRVINFDFYNDWVNGVLYFPRWKMTFSPRKKYKTVPEKTKGCMSEPNKSLPTRRLYQQCALSYSFDGMSALTTPTMVTKHGCVSENGVQNCHMNSGKKQIKICGKNGGLIKQQETIANDYVYYYKPCEWTIHNGYDRNVKVNLFATDLVLIGSLNECSKYGIPQAFKDIIGTSYKMPTNLALTNMDTNSYLYGTSNGTYCGGITDSKDFKENSITRIQPSFRATAAYYSGMTNSEQYISYGNEGTVYEDMYPVTEAAGISWDYTGPDQGKANKHYNPGGHFLGMSCTNSTTNVKTCINLQRICEIGASMSERRTRLIRYENNRPVYHYFVPTGFIGTDDITNSSFRSMFATMNMNKLICEENDINTGYKKYLFRYSSPNGFDGTGYGLTTNGHYSSEYNLAPPSESSLSIEISAIQHKISDKSFNLNGTPYVSGKITRGESDTLADIKLPTRISDVISPYADVRFFLGLDGVEVPDSFDIYEMARTYRKTRDAGNISYYKFRLGLNGASPTIEDAKWRYAYEHNGTYAMPQYENSFYFYFGLHDGSTAIDEFKANFFAECESDDESNGSFITVTKTSDDYSSVATYTIKTYGMTSPYTVTLYDRFGSIKKQFTANRDLSVINIEEEGNYTLEVSDVNGIKITYDIEFKLAEMYASFITKDVKYLSNGVQDIIAQSKAKDCGYIEFDEYIDVNGENFNINEDDDVAVLIYQRESDTAVISNTAFTQAVRNYEMFANTNIIDNAFTGDNRSKLYLPMIDCDYLVYIIYGKSTSALVKLYDTFRLYGSDKIDLCLGCRYLSYDKMSQLVDGPNNWVTSRVSDTTIDNWLIRHFITNQSCDSSTTFDCNVYAINNRDEICNSYILFGQPENSVELFVKPGETNVMCNTDKKKYLGYTLNDSNVRRGTYNVESGKVTGRDVFGKMNVFGGNVLSEQYGQVHTVTGVTTSSDGSIRILLGNTITDIRIKSGHGCVVKHGDDVFGCTVMGSNEIRCYKDMGIEVGDTVGIYPLLFYPVVESPFRTKVMYLAWNKPKTDGTRLTSLSVRGSISNGLTYNNKFGDSNFFGDIAGGMNGIIPNTTGKKDFVKGRKAEFGQITVPNQAIYTLNMKTENLASLSYYITEGNPGGALTKEMNEPEPIRLAKSSNHIDVVFPDEVELNYRNGGFLIERTRLSSGMRPSTDNIRYFAISDDITLPFNATTKEPSVTMTPDNEMDYYISLLENAREIELNKVYKNGELNQSKYVLAYASSVLNGSEMHVIKFFIL